MQIKKGKKQWGIHLGHQEDVDSWMALVKRVRGEFPGFETQRDMEEHRQTVLRFMDEGRALCVKEAGSIAGVLLLSRKHNMICCLAVAPEYRRRGIASALLTRAISMLDGGREITVTTFCEEDARGAAPRALYARFGFEPAALCVEYGCPAERFVRGAGKEGQA